MANFCEGLSGYSKKYFRRGGISDFDFDFDFDFDSDFDSDSDIVFWDNSLISKSGPMVFGVGAV